MLRTLYILIIASHVSLNADTLVKRTQSMMGTYVSISLERESLPLSNIIFDRIKNIEKALSSYDKEADIYRLNHLHKTDISVDTYEALSLSAEYYKQTQGYFDVTIGSITKGLFRFGEEERIPTQKELSDVKVDFKGLHFTQEKAWIDEGVKIDLGGMGKGFAVDKAVKLLKKQGISRGVVALSGDIFCLHACVMSIQDPFSESTLARFTMAQKNTAISTSGNYRRYVQSTQYNHLINPKTKKSQKTFASISLISDRYNNSDLDAFATAASVMLKQDAFVFLNAFRGLGYLVVSNDKKIVINEAFTTLTKELKITGIEESVRLKPLLYLP
ncbi:FAD:protein FMN transferase [Campylobacterota bacterium]